MKKRLMVTCQSCGKSKPVASFLKTKSEFFPLGTTDICIECFEDKIERDNGNFKTMDKICRWLDIPFFPDKWAKMYSTMGKLAISKYVETIYEESYPMLQEKNLECIFDKPKTIPFLGDGDKLARAFGNLLKNAISYSYPDTTIQIDIKEENDIIQVIFKNKGDKIPEFKLEKIFDKFYRIDEARTSSTGGAGLGLAITKQIIELHDGKIYVKNDDEFIEFYIELKKL